MAITEGLVIHDVSEDHWRPMAKRIAFRIWPLILASALGYFIGTFMINSL